MTFYIKEKAWKLEIEKHGSDKLLMDGAECIAQLFKKTRTIYLDGDILQDPRELWETLVHELTHAYIMTYGISHEQFRDEEFICEFVAIYGKDITDTAQSLICAL